MRIFILLSLVLISMESLVLAKDRTWLTPPPDKNWWVVRGHWEPWTDPETKRNGIRQSDTFLPPSPGRLSEILDFQKANIISPVTNLASVSFTAKAGPIGKSYVHMLGFYLQSGPAYYAFMIGRKKTKKKFLFFWEREKETTYAVIHYYDQKTPKNPYTYAVFDSTNMNFPFVSNQNYFINVVFDIKNGAVFSVNGKLLLTRKALGKLSKGSYIFGLLGGWHPFYVKELVLTESAGRVIKKGACQNPVFFRPSFKGKFRFKSVQE